MLRNSSIGNKYWHLSFYTFYSKHNEEINRLAAVVCKIGWLVDYRNNGFSGVSAEVGKAFFTGFHVFVLKLGCYIQ